MTTSSEQRALDACREYEDRYLRGELLDPEEFIRSKDPDLHEPLRRFIANFEHFLQRAGSGPFTPAKGVEIGGFRLVGKIGEGGFAQVWEAVQLDKQRAVALKILHGPARTHPLKVRRFQQEAEIGRQLRHPGIVQVYAVGEQHDTWYIAQELVPGGRTLADRMDEWRKRPPTGKEHFRRIAGLFASIADALHAAHEAGVIHRDVKPRNILMAPGDRPKVADFGLARLEEGPALSRTGDFAGTREYMSPEQVTGRRIGLDRRTDIFSLGTCLYEALTGVRPFLGDERQVLKQIVVSDPAAPLRVRESVPPALSTICLKALEKDPDARYPAMAALAEDLRHFLAEEAIEARAPGPVRRAGRFLRRHPRTVGAVALTAVLLFLAGYGLQYGQRQADRAALQQAGSAMGTGWKDFEKGDLLAAFVRLERGIRLESGLVPGSQYCADALRFAERLNAVGAPALALQHVDRVLTLAKDDATRARALLLRGRIRGGMGNLVSSLEDLARAESVFRRSGNIEEAGRMQRLAKRLAGLAWHERADLLGSYHDGFLACMADTDGDGRDEVWIFGSDSKTPSFPGEVWKWTKQGLESRGFRLDLPKLHLLGRAQYTLRPRTIRMKDGPDRILLSYGPFLENAALMEKPCWRITWLVPMVNGGKPTFTPDPPAPIPGANIVATAFCLEGLQGRPFLALALAHPLRKVFFLAPDSLGKTLATLKLTSDPRGIVIGNVASDQPLEVVMAEGHPQVLGIERYRHEGGNWSRDPAWLKFGRVVGLQSLSGDPPRLLTFLQETPKSSFVSERDTIPALHQGPVEISLEKGKMVPTQWRSAKNFRTPVGVSTNRPIPLPEDGTLVRLSNSYRVERNQLREEDLSSNIWALWEDAGWPVGPPLDQLLLAGELDGSPGMEFVYFGAGQMAVLGTGHTPSEKLGEGLGSTTKLGGILEGLARCVELGREAIPDLWRNVIEETIAAGYVRGARKAFAAASEVGVLPPPEEQSWPAGMRVDLALLDLDPSEVSPKFIAGDWVEGQLRLIPPDLRQALARAGGPAGGAVLCETSWPQHLDSGLESIPEWKFQGFPSLKDWDPIYRELERYASKGGKALRLPFIYDETRCASWALPAEWPGNVPVRVRINLVVTELQYAMSLAFLFKPDSDNTLEGWGFRLTHSRVEGSAGDIWGFRPEGIGGPAVTSCADPRLIRNGDMLCIELIFLPSIHHAILRVRRRDDGPGVADLCRVQKPGVTISPQGRYRLTISNEASHDGLKKLKYRAEILVKQITLEDLSQPPEK